MKNFTNFIFITSAVIGIALLLSFEISSDKSKILDPYPNFSQRFMEQHPPYPVKYWVQKLATPTANGENLIFKVKYESDSRLPTSIDLYGNAVSVQYTLKDDGNYPDDIAGDGKYACLKKENISNLLDEINTMTSKIQNVGYAVRFRGHAGEIKRFSELIAFNHDLFNSNSEVEIDAMLIDAELCSEDIKLEKSLFITDLSVVEDQSRTYNVATGVGSPNGIWTFGTLMSNI